MGDEFVEYIVEDQLGSLGVTAKRMFGGYGLYVEDAFFGIIYKSCLYIKTNPHTRIKYIEAGMKPFKPSATQTLKSYYQVPADVLEDSKTLQKWVIESLK